MSIKIDLHNGSISHAEFMKLIKGGASLDLNTAPPKPYKWILDAVWLNLVELSTLHPFTDLLQQVLENEREWRSWVEKEKPEQEEIPCGYTKALAGIAFRKLLLIRSWCPDRMLQSAQNYVIHSLGNQFIDSPLLDLEVMWSESEPRVPLICVLTTCSDPSQKIEHLARQRDIEIKALSMGQGQEIHARRLLADSMLTGHWLLLQNCHLNLAFCHELLESLMEGDVHAGFRLWITTEVHPQFPISLLQTAIKFTNEPPQGIRASMKRTLTDVPQDLLDYSPSPSWPTLVYTVAFLHTVLMERRKYGPLGWNTQYEFNQSDLNGAIQCVQNHLDDMDPRKGISWPTICFMIGEAQYGGRVNYFISLGDN
jgi:dynein heavy chain